MNNYPYSNRSQQYQQQEAYYYDPSAYYPQPQETQYSGDRYANNDQPCSSGYSSRYNNSKKPRYEGNSKRRTDGRRYNNNNNNNNNIRNRSGQDKKVNFTLEDGESADDSSNDNDETADKQVGYQEASYIQTTLIPIYYAKDSTNAKLINGTLKLKDLCAKFNSEVVQRSRLVREKTNDRDLAIPNYRQLLQTKKFSNFSTCNCDQPTNTKDKNHHHHHHRHHHHKSSGNSDNDSSCSSSESSSSSSDSESNSSYSSSSCGSETTEGREKKERAKKTKKKSEDELSEFDDIRSMEINRKLNHPERLHPDLSFNEPEQTNEGPLCKCKLKNTTFGTRHQIYYKEEMIPSCEEFSNNGDRLYHYRMTITPYTNFIHRAPTFIEYDKHEYVFEGFSLFSHEKLPNMPDCVVVIYNHEYKLNIASEDMIENFTIKELELLKSYIFEEILELYDLKWKAYNVNDGCNSFHVMPRFCRTLPYNGKEMLSPCEIIKYFMSNSVPIVNGALLSKVHQMSDTEWQRYVENIQGSLVTCPGKRPSSIRLDQLDRDHLLSKSASQHAYPLIIHFNMFRNTWLPMMKNNLKLKKMYHKYFKLRHLLNNKSKLTTDDKTKLRTLGEQLEAMIKKASEVSKEIMIELNSENFYSTGIRTDIVQQAVLIPTFIEHVRFHLSLKYLEDKLGYVFKNRLLLQYALTHPSGAFLLHQNLGSNPDHIRNTLYNCRARNPNYGDLTPQKRKSLLRKKGIHMLFSIMSQKGHDIEESSCISNYERLEFLGDKILELLTSKHLFFLFPMFDEGQLSEYRNALVQNQYLAVLARKLDMHYFIIFYHGVDLCSNSALNHALANSFEALLAAVFLDSGLDTVSTMLCRILWDESDLKSVWSELPPHPIQAQQPEGDRYLIGTTKILQHVQKFEDMIGLEFNHIRLLAQAFCTRSASFNLITLGDNQRLEFLGDTVLNFVVSDYLYRHFPKHHEGHLSLLRSSLVCNSTQALLYDELGMADFVLTSYINNRAENNGNLKRKADVFEAFVGALYIDQGLEAVVVFCSVCMFNKLQDIILYQFWNDPKSRLQQCCLSLRDVDESKPALPTYKLIEEKGPPNRKQYKVAVYFMRKRIGDGIGKSIHEAEVEAAKNALKTNADMFPILNKYVMSKTTNTLSTIVLKSIPNNDEESKAKDLNSVEKPIEHIASKTTKRKHDKSPVDDELEEGECKEDQKRATDNKKSQNGTKVSTEGGIRSHSNVNAGRNSNIDGKQSRDGSLKSNYRPYKDDNNSFRNNSSQPRQYYNTQQYCNPPQREPNYANYYAQQQQANYWHPSNVPYAMPPRLPPQPYYPPRMPFNRPPPPPSTQQYNNNPAYFPQHKPHSHSNGGYYSNS